MWFLFAILTTISWGAADLFYKIGSNSDDKYSHLKIAVAVGFVMGLHALIYYFAKGVDMTIMDVVKYLPISACYIISMIVGYIGLRYLTLSISSPIQNTSGVIVTILMVICFGTEITSIEIAGIVIITVALVVLAILENHYGEKVELSNADKKYKFSFLAIVFPLIYCVIDALGTFGDAIYLDEMEIISEDAALISYEFTFFIVGVVCLVYLIGKRKSLERKLRLSAEYNSNITLTPDERRSLIDNRHKLIEKFDGARFIAAVLETIGQFFYVFAMSSHAVIAAPLVACYCAFSMLFSRIFLKEKLKAPQYITLFIVMAGIVLLGVAEGLAE